MDSTPCVSSPKEALEKKEFAAFIDQNRFSNVLEGYTQHPTLPVAYRIQDSLPGSLDEKWRKVYLDVNRGEI